MTKYMHTLKQVYIYIYIYIYIFNRVTMFTPTK